MVRVIANVRQTLNTVPKPVLQLMVGDKELRAIGHVAAQWAYLETQLDFVTAILVNQPSTKNLGLKQSQSFQRRMECLRKAAKVALTQHEEERDELLAIVTDASSLRGFRDDIVHGHWKLHRERGRGPLTTGIRVFNQGPKLKVRNIAFSSEKAEDVACKIAATNLRLVVWTTRNIPERS